MSRQSLTASRRLSETSKATVFSATLLALALAAALVIRALDPPQLVRRRQPVDHSAAVHRHDRRGRIRLRQPPDRTGSVWPAAIAHGVHNASWGALAALTVTSSPVLVNEYLAGDTGFVHSADHHRGRDLAALVASTPSVPGVVSQ